MEKGDGIMANLSLRDVFTLTHRERLIKEYGEDVAPWRLAVAEEMDKAEALHGKKQRGRRGLSKEEEARDAIAGEMFGISMGWW
jgi:hypothetical protein